MRTSNFDGIAFKAKFQFKIESEHPIAVFVLRREGFITKPVKTARECTK